MGSNGVDTASGQSRAQEVSVTGRITDREQTVAVLTNPAYTVPEPLHDGVPGTLAWLRASVSRFRNGGPHRVRRERVQTELSRLAACDLSEMAAVITRARYASSDAPAPNRIEAIAFHVPVAVLAEALGFAEPERMPALVGAVAPSYFTGEGTQATDAAVRELLAAASADASRVDTALARVGILLQAYDATGRLIERAAAKALRTDHYAMPVEAILGEVLRYDPPVAVLRRQDTVGRIIEIDVAAVEATADTDQNASDQDTGVPLTFGIGPRGCPGVAESIAIAAGVVTAIRAHSQHARETR